MFMTRELMIFKCVGHCLRVFYFVFKIFAVGYVRVTDNKSKDKKLLLVGMATPQSFLHSPGILGMHTQVIAVIFKPTTGRKP